MLESVDRCNLADSLYLSETIPIGYVYMQIRQYDLAIESLQACIPLTPNNAVIYGYLGDAYFLRGEPDVARQCYLEACLIEPACMDWGHMKDGDLLKLRDLLIEKYNMDNSLDLEWLPSYAYIQGLFKPKTIKLNEGLKEFVEEYLKLQKVYFKEQTSDLKAKLFIRSIVLCDNEPFLKFIKGIDFIDIRRQMKEANPSLFAKYLRNIKSNNRDKR